MGRINYENGSTIEELLTIISNFREFKSALPVYHITMDRANSFIAL